MLQHLATRLRIRVEEVGEITATWAPGIMDFTWAFPECFIHPKGGMFYEPGKPRTWLLHSWASLALGIPFDETWKLKRNCKTEGCRNLAHYTINPRMDRFGLREWKDLPK
jgi:hypothetical protein